MNKHLFPYKWNLSNGYKNQNKRNVFGTFICGGGSSMGYKLAGFNHLGGNEIDPKIATVYKKNHNPKYLYVEDIREFNKRTDLPEELYHLDILDGSPPCSTFSMSGSREKVWGKEKKFSEGQALQTLDDLVFEYCETINKLQPKVCLLENVKGIIAGNAKWYAKEIVRKLNSYGYTVQVFKLDASTMGVPQRRERVFFIGHKKELKYPELKLEFNERRITFKELELKGIERKQINSKYIIKLMRYVTKTGVMQTEKKSIGGRIGAVGFGYCCMENEVPLTVTSGGSIIHKDKKHYAHEDEIKIIGSFPMDYNFLDVKVQYLIGMSVPPVMIAQIANQINIQWFQKSGVIQ